MRTLFATLMLLPSLCYADPGGVQEAISKIALSARLGTALSLNLRVTGTAYVPWPALHSADGKTEYASIGLGADLGKSVNGTALKGAPLVIPLVNIPGILSKAFAAPWAKSHLTWTDVGNLSLGVGVLPLPVPGSGGKWIIGNQTEAMLTWGWGK